MHRRRAILHRPTALLAVAVLGLLAAGCDPVEGHEGGLFKPYQGGVVQQTDDAADGGATDGGIQLPDAADFAPDEPTPSPVPLVLDTGGPPALTLGDDDDSAGDDGLTDLGVPPDPGTTPAIEPPTPAVVEPPTPAAVQAVPLQTSPVLTVPVQTVPVQTAPVAAATTPLGETALAVSAPLSDILLVAAIPDASSPRAIVRFPTGEERVVRIGDLLGDSGAKVVLIGAGFIKLAELTVDEPDRPALVTHYLHRTQ